MPNSVVCKLHEIIVFTLNMKKNFFNFFNSGIEKYNN